MFFLLLGQIVLATQLKLMHPDQSCSLILNCSDFSLARKSYSFVAKNGQICGCAIIFGIITLDRNIRVRVQKNHDDK